jgi:hypothetical protein
MHVLYDEALHRLWSTCRQHGVIPAHVQESLPETGRIKSSQLLQTLGLLGHDSYDALKTPAQTAHTAEVAPWEQGLIDAIDSYRDNMQMDAAGSVGTSTGLASAETSGTRRSSSLRSSTSSPPPLPRTSSWLMSSRCAARPQGLVNCELVPVKPGWHLQQEVQQLTTTDPADGQSIVWAGPEPIAPRDEVRYGEPMWSNDLTMASLNDLSWWQHGGAIQY